MRNFIATAILSLMSSVAFTDNIWVLVDSSAPEASLNITYAVLNPGELENQFWNYWAWDVTRTIQVKAVWGDTNSAPAWRTELSTLVIPATTLTKTIYEDGFYSDLEPKAKWTFWYNEYSQTFQEHQNTVPPTPLSSFAIRDGWEKTGATFVPVAYVF